MQFKKLLVALMLSISCVTILGFTGKVMYSNYQENLTKKINEIASNSHKMGYKQGYAEAEKKLIGLLEKDFDNFRTELLAYYSKEKYPVKEYLLVDKRIEEIIKKSNPKLKQEKIDEYKKYIRKWSVEHELDPVFIASMIHRESHFKEDSVSKANARGAMQVVFKWWRPQCDKLGITEKDLHSIDHGINIGCQAFKTYLVKTDGDYRKALKLYNGDHSKKDSPYVTDILRMTLYGYSVTL